MTKPVRPYSRVYWEARDDAKFARVWSDDRVLGCWLRLLVAADMAWPASADLYHGVNRKSLALLVDAGLVDVQGAGSYRIHGLDKERNGRSEAGRDSANVRWHGSPEGIPAPYGGNTNGMRPHYQPNASQDETRRDETRRDDARGNADDGRRERARAREMAYQRGELTEAELAALREADSVPLRTA